MDVRPFNGVYTLSLPAARCNRVDGCAVGGQVTLLVQGDGAGATIVQEMTQAGLVPLVGESN